LQGQDLKEGRVNRSKMFFHPILSPKDYSVRLEPEFETQTVWRNFEEINGIFDKDGAIKEANRCFDCNHFCAHCQDFAAINADLTAGDIGSEKSLTTVVVWTRRAKKIVEEMIEKGLLIPGPVNPEAVDLAITKKMKRKLLDHAKTPREKVFTFIKLNGPQSIPQLSQALELPVKETRFHALRLAQLNQLSFSVVEGEPIFALSHEE